MSDIQIISPVKKPKDIEDFVKKSSCRAFYVYHHKFMNGNFSYIHEFVDTAKKCNSKIYVNFKHNITEADLYEIKQFIGYLKMIAIDGIFVNSFVILEAIKPYRLPFSVVIDSYFEIHNLSGIDFVNNFHKVDRVIITEEIYMKNIAKIKQYTNLSLAIDSDNLPWCAEGILKLKAINSVVIKGKFYESSEILDAIELIEKILAKPKIFKNQTLPFKHIRKCVYQTNHFSGDMISAEGDNFKFSRNIKRYEWNYKRSRLVKDYDYAALDIPKLNLRLSGIEQVRRLKKFIEKIGFNPVYSIEYGEILSTSDLYKSSFSELITKVKKFCDNYNIKLQISTPRILIERDFDRVYDYVKTLCLTSPQPSSLIANNIGYFWAAINDDDLNKIPIEIGTGINLLSSMSIMCLNNLHSLDAVDFSAFQRYENIKLAANKIKNIIPRRKITIAGNVRVPSSGLCPLNNDSAIVSRLSCKAPCHNGHYALKDPALDKLLPFVVDGFCRMHMYSDKILHLYNYMDKFMQFGINEFVIDLSNLEPALLPIMLTNFLNAAGKVKEVEHETLGLYGIY